MKKIISVIAALAMVGAFVGCDFGPIEFKEHTETISHSDTAYPITDVDVVIGKDCLKADLYVSTSNPNYSSVTFTTKQEGSAGVIFYSKQLRKRAEKTLTIMGSGSILQSFSPLKYTTYNSTSSGYNHNESWWVDDPSADLGCGKTGMYFYDFTNYETDGNGDPIEANEAYIYIKGDIIYYLKYDSYSENDIDGSINCYYKWARGVATKNGDNITIEWGSTGKLNNRVTVNVSSTTEKLIATNETTTGSPASIVPSLLRSSVKFMYSSSQKEVTFGTNDLIFKYQDNSDENAPYYFSTDKEWETLN